MGNLLAQVNIGNDWLIRNGVGINSPAAPQFSSIGAIVSIVLKNVYTLAGILLFILLIVGGFSFITGAGNNDAKKAASGKQAITNALIGFLIIFGSMWIIMIIETITGIRILNPSIGDMSRF